MRQTAELVAVTFRANPEDDRGTCEVAFFLGQPTLEQLREAAGYAEGESAESEGEFPTYAKDRTDNPELTAYVVAF